MINPELDIVKLLKYKIHIIKIKSELLDFILDLDYDNFICPQLYRFVDGIEIIKEDVVSLEQSAKQIDNFLDLFCKEVKIENLRKNTILENQWVIDNKERLIKLDLQFSREKKFKRILK